MTHLWWALGGAWVGGIVGFFTAALCCAARRADTPHDPSNPDAET